MFQVFTDKSNVYWRFLLIACCFFTACEKHDKTTLRPAYPAIAQICPEGDRLLLAQHYTAAADAYTTCLNQDDFVGLEKLYLLNQAAHAHLMRYDQQAAQPLLDTATITAEALTEIPLAVRADLAFNRGRFLYLNHQLAEALPLLHRAHADYKKAYSEEHLRIGQVLTTIALVQFEYHPTVDSLAFYTDRAFQYLQTAPALLPYAAEVYFAKAAASLYDRAHERGDNYCKAVINTLDGLPEQPIVLKGRNLALFGNMLKKQGDIENAKPQANRSKVERYHRRADTLMAEAVELLRGTSSDYWQEAFRDWTVMAKRFKKTPGLIRERIARAEAYLHNQEDHFIFPARMHAYLSVGSDPKAPINKYEQFLDQHLDRPRPTFQLLDEAYYMLRTHYRNQGDFERARHYQREGQVLFSCIAENTSAAQAVAHGAMSTWSTACLNGLSALADIELREYRAGGEPRHLLTAAGYLDSLDKYWLQSIVRSDEDAVLTYISEVGSKLYANALDSNYELWRTTLDEHYLDRCFHYAERTKSFLTYREKVGALTGHPALRKLQADILSLEARFDHAGLDTQQQFHLFQLQDEFEQTLLAWRRDSVAYQLAHQQPTSSISTVKAELPRHNALLHFTEVEDAYFVTYLDERRHQFYKVPKTDLLRKCLTDYHGSVRAYEHPTPDILQLYQTSARALYNAFITPIAHHLAQCEALVIVPDGGLHALPFGALLPPGPTFTIEEFRDAPFLFRALDIRYTSSWKSWRNGRRLPPLNLRAPGAIYADEHLVAKNEFAQLHDKITSISAARPTTTTDGENTTDFLAQNAAELIHLTLHANSSAGDRHGNLVIFGAGDTLYSYDIVRADLDIRLLVLAACETAVGTYHPGEGSFHLVRSFQQAGVHEIVATFWRVPQKGTARLFTYFYEALEQGRPSATALRLAKLRYLEQADSPRMLFPGNWAGVAVW